MTEKEREQMTEIERLKSDWIYTTGFARIILATRKITPESEILVGDEIERLTTLHATRGFEVALGREAGPGWPWAALLGIFAVAYLTLGALLFRPLLLHRRSPWLIPLAQLQRVPLPLLPLRLAFSSAWMAVRMLHIQPVVTPDLLPVHIPCRRATRQDVFPRLPT